MGKYRIMVVIAFYLISDSFSNNFYLHITFITIQNLLNRRFVTSVLSTLLIHQRYFLTFFCDRIIPGLFVRSRKPTPGLVPPSTCDCSLHQIQLTTSHSPSTHSHLKKSSVSLSTWFKNSDQLKSGHKFC